jgi:hypothetical protein
MLRFCLIYQVLIPPANIKDKLKEDVADPHRVNLISTNLQLLRELATVT